MISVIQGHFQRTWIQYPSPTKHMLLWLLDTKPLPNCFSVGVSRYARFINWLAINIEIEYRQYANMPVISKW